MINHERQQLFLFLALNIAVFWLVVWIVVLQPTVGAAEERKVPPIPCPTTGPPCEKNSLAPFVRIAALEVGMLVVAGAIWPDTYNPVQVRKNARQFASSWTSPPEFHFDQPLFGSDNDWWYFNVFAHGLFGSEAYLAGRIFGHSPFISMAYAVFASFTWEYLWESWYQPPSAIDLFWTPFSGFLIGELRYRAFLAAKRGIAKRALRQTVLVLLDPLGELERFILGCEVR